MDSCDAVPQRRFISRLGITFFAALLCALVLHQSGLFPSGKLSREPRPITVNSMKRTYLPVYYRSQVDSNFWVLFDQRTNDVKSLQKWLGLVSKNITVEVEKLSEAEYGPGDSLNDGWRCPINIRRTDQRAQVLPLNSNMVPQFGHLILWSNGPNQVNENGWGDDVWISLEVLRSYYDAATKMAKDN